jgi:hypothetical protein
MNFISENIVLLNNFSLLKLHIFTPMKTFRYGIFLLMIMLPGSCIGKRDHAGSSVKPHANITKAEVARVVKNYFKQKFRDPVISENEGLVRVQGFMEMGIFSEDKIFIGKLDNDETQDAVVTYGYQKTGSMALDRHLILLNTDSLRVVKDFPRAMTIQEIASRRVIAVADTSPRELNAQPCPSCRMLIEFRLAGDSLVRVK